MCFCYFHKISFKYNPAEVEEDDDDDVSQKGTNKATKGEIVYGDYLQVR